MLLRAAAIGLSAAFLTSATVIAPTYEALAQKTKTETKSGMSYRERQKACSAEWKEAKAANKTGGVKWPKFWSACNKRLKTKSA
jgi:hypothetical protein